jgi:phosphoglycerol transferase MdoB-like AlkP superfamily enzyme
MNASRKRKNTKPKGFWEKLKEQRNEKIAARNKKSDKKNDILKKAGSSIITLLLVILPPAACFYLMEWYSHNPFMVVRPWAQFFNIVLFLLVTIVLFLLTGKLKTAHRIVYGVAMIYGIANSYVVRFRTNPIVPWDIFSWKTAASVADNYNFMPDTRMVVVTLVFLVAIALFHFIKVKVTRFVFWKRLIPAALVAVVLSLFAGTLQQESFQNSHRLYNKLFTPVYMTDVDGMAVTFVMNLAYMSIDKPEHYSDSEAQAVLDSYGAGGAMTEDTDPAAKDDTQKDEELPNIIVMMNESFSDLSVLGDFETNEDYMPFIHSLEQGAENTVTGMLNVSVCGGNTANTEFEFLTGNTMAFLPQGSIPYQQYINGDLKALPDYLKTLGYQTIATHPYNAGGWERDTVYPMLGFNESVFKDEYVNPQYVRQYISDESCVDKIIEFYENKETDKPLFVFNVTMQNHGGYQDQYGNFTPDISVKDSTNFSLQQYLSLVKLSDSALESLISYFKDADEKTVIVFFGDHQPSDAVASTVLAKNGMSWNHLTEEQQKLRYQVPYVVWANYDIDEETGADTSANYLAAEVLERAGVPLDEYRSYLMHLKTEYPVISAVRTVKADGSEVRGSDEKDEMDIYRKLQYYELFDHGTVN